MCRFRKHGDGTPTFCASESNDSRRSASHWSVDSLEELVGVLKFSITSWRYYEKQELSGGFQGKSG